MKTRQVNFYFCPLNHKMEKITYGFHHIIITKETLTMAKLVPLIFLFLIFNIQASGSSGSDTIPEHSSQDTTTVMKIGITAEHASGYLKRLIEDKQLWKDSDDTLKQILIHLLQQYKTPFDSTRTQLSGFDFSRLNYDTTLITKHDTLPLQWLNDTLLYVDTVPLRQSPILTQKTIIKKTVIPDSSTLKLLDSISDLSIWIDSVVKTSDTLVETMIDFPYLQSSNIRLHRVVRGKVVPPFVPTGTSKTVRWTNDSSQVIITNYKLALMGNPQSPFNILPNGHVQDSIGLAISTILDYTWKRDSVQLYLSRGKGKKTPFWLTSGKSDLFRYWLRNSQNDSITVWLGNPSKYELSMRLEERVNVERMGIIPPDDITFTTNWPDLTPAPIKPLQEIPVFWSYGFIGSFSINQNFITYWAQGAESSFSGQIDLNGHAKYTNKAKNTEWLSSGRFRFGSISTKENGLRINTDILELNSQFNKIIANKLDFSSVFYFKTQIAKGYDYPNDSIAISKFLNPGTFTIGIGAEYKPFENTLINFSPLSYKNTFVLDTAGINQQKYGVDVDKNSKQEIGGQLVIKNNLTLFEELKVGNTLRLFSNYAENPQNVDVDWEMSVERRISWIFSVKLNIHLIYDDDVLFTVPLPEGGEKQAPRTQFNQFLGLSVSLNL